MKNWKKTRRQKLKKRYVGTVKLKISIDNSELKQKLRQCAIDRGWSVNKLIVYLVRQQMEKDFRDSKQELVNEKV